MIAMTVDDMRTGSAKAAALMGALSHEGRLLIMCALCEKEHGVSELLRITGLGQSALSQHLAKLRSDDLVTTRRESQTIFYSLNNPTVKSLLEILHHDYCAQK